MSISFEKYPGRRTGSDAPASEPDALPGRTMAGQSAVRWTARRSDRPSSHLRTRWSDLVVAERESGHSLASPGLQAIPTISGYSDGGRWIVITGFESPLKSGRVPMPHGL